MTTIIDQAPAEYREVIQDAVLKIINRHVWDLDQAVPGSAPAVIPLEAMLNSPLADQLVEIARLATGDLPATPDNVGVVAEGIQMVMERLFSSPVLGAYDVPAAFWQTPLGAMINRALFVIQGDALITVSEAASLRGVTTQTISGHIARGNLRAFVDPAEPNPQRSTRVLRSEVEALRA